MQVDSLFTDCLPANWGNLLAGALFASPMDKYGLKTLFLMFIVMTFVSWRHFIRTLELLVVVNSYTRKSQQTVHQ